MRVYYRKHHTADTLLPQESDLTDHWQRPRLVLTFKVSRLVRVCVVRTSYCVLQKLKVRLLLGKRGLRLQWSLRTTGQRAAAGEGEGEGVDEGVDEAGE